MSTPFPTSEVGSDPPLLDQTDVPSTMSQQMSIFSNGMEAIFQKILDKMNSRQAPPLNTKLVPFDPDEPESDITNWCTLSEMIINERNLEGVDLIIALTHALKGQAAACLTKIKPENLSWLMIKDILISKFSKPMMMQDHFDRIIKFRLGNKDTPAEAGMRLWQLIENIPEANFPESVSTGFVISVLSQCDDKIRRELNSVVINNKHQLFRTLRGFSLKRANEDPIASESEQKRARNTVFRGSCHNCGKIGHRGIECRSKPRSNMISLSTKPDSTRTATSCYICHDTGHIATTCPKRYSKKEDGATSNKQVNVCSKAPRGTLEISGMMLSFIFDSGSECSLVKQSTSKFLIGERFHEQVILKGIGSSNIICSVQIKCSTLVQNFPLDIIFHVLPDDCLSEEILLGRDILQNGLSVKVDSSTVTFSSTKFNNFCSKRDESSYFRSIDTDLTGSDKDKLISILEKYSDKFIDNLPTTRAQTGELKIDLIDPNKIVHRRPYRLSPSELDIVNDKVKELLEANIIRESSSQFASPIILVKKKDGTDRMCVDYRELNRNTRPDSYPLPLISDQINKLHGAKYFSSIDMASGFHQIKVHEDSIDKTAFVTPTGQYEYLTMPFGLRNAPQVFQRAINNSLKKLNDDKILVYMDDVLSASETVDEGLARLDNLLMTLTEAGFSFNFKKCSFMKTRIEYLGFVISSGEVRPNPRKIEALQKLPTPTTVTQVRQLIGLASYFRQFIPDFSKLLKPLYPLTALGKGKITWTSEHDKILKTIITHLTTEPVLKIFDPLLPIELHTDASSEGYGAVLIQKVNNLPHVVAYFSHRTTDAESRYHSYELETLAVVRAVEHFRHFLYGRKFTVFTDCNSLKASHSKRDLTPRVHRWWAILQSYDFDVVYKEGKNMAHADFLSRNFSHESLSPKTSREPKCVNFSELEKGWLLVEQQRDPEISDIVSKLRSDDYPLEMARTYDVRQGILYRKIERGRISKWLPIIPRSLTWTLIGHVHTEIKHLGFEKTLDKLYDLYWFPNMAKFVKKYVDSCVICKASKGPSGAQQVQLHPISKPAIPWHTIHLDLSGKLSGKSERKEYCSVAIDSFTKFVILEHTTSLNSSNAIKAVQNLVNLFGAPKRIIADRGRSYDNVEFKKFCKDHNILLHLIATGSSRANGQVERVMRTLKSLLTIIECDSDSSWQDQLGEIQLALNSTRCRVTGFTPIELMFGINGNSLGLSKIAVNPDGDHAERLDLDEIRSSASDSIVKLSRADSLRFNRGKATIKPFSIGDYVFVKSEERHQTKLDRKYKGPFQIVAILDNDRYELKHINGSNRVFKYSHENLRAVPRGPSAFLDVIENLSDDDVSAESDSNIVHETARQSDASDTDTAGSSTLTAASNTYHATNSHAESNDTDDSMSVLSEPTQMVVQADVHRS